MGPSQFWVHNDVNGNEMWGSHWLASRKLSERVLFYAYTLIMVFINYIQLKKKEKRVTKKYKNKEGLGKM